MQPKQQQQQQRQRMDRLRLSPVPHLGFLMPEVQCPRVVVAAVVAVGCTCGGG
jgi:hypothetical protein